MTRLQLARKAGVGDGAIRKVEEGESRQPSFENGVRLARALGVWPDEIALEKPFASDVACEIAGVVVEMRVRIRGDDAVRKQAIDAIRTALKGMSRVLPIAPPEETAVLEADVRELQRRADAILAQIERLKH